MLRIRFASPNTKLEDVVDELSTTKDGARMKVQRALNSLIRNLGGFKPFHDEDVIVAEEDDDDTSTES